MSKRKANGDGNDDSRPKSGRKKQSSTIGVGDDVVVVPLPFVPPDFNPNRARVLTQSHAFPASGGDCVILWMSRDQRAIDNHALLYARGVAAHRNVPLKVVFNLVPTFLEATLRQYDFMITGLREVEEQLRSKHIPMYLTMGDPVVNIPQFAATHNALMLVGDFSPLRIGQMWSKQVAEKLDNSSSPARRLPYVQVDAHNVVPCWIASTKCEYSARTIRTKITTKTPEYLKPYPDLEPNPSGGCLDGCAPIDWTTALASLQINRSVGKIDWLAPGTAAGLQTLQSFIDTRLKDYADKRNDPNNELLSNMSPYFHFGQVSVQRAVLEVKLSKRYPGSADSFIEEAVVRRELADNFCFYNAHYDSLEGCYEWARETLRVHEADPRSVLYSLDQLEQAQTHDDLWNAAQLQMTRRGKMHGFLRMYWAKKILEWSPSPAEALRRAIFLNDKYELDGRDPNGYVGCMWSIGGIHDQGWAERAIFGKIRFMNYAGCKRKFDVAAFVGKFLPALANAQAAATTRGIKVGGI